MKTVAIVIPIYKSQPTENELLSLKRCALILKDYDAYLVAPEGLNTSIYTQNYKNLEVITFATKFFKNISGYNQLMLSAGFYKKFLGYEYILLYQLDAYVFRDELMAWCSRGYDYVGAPWLVPPPVTKQGKILFDLSKRLVNQVGNGGFSLRRIKSHYQNCLIFKPLIKIFMKNEDLFWSYFLPKINPFFKRPSAQEALAFAMENPPKLCYERNQNRLPFGVHAWEKYDKTFWEKFFML